MLISTFSQKDKLASIDFLGQLVNNIRMGWATCRMISVFYFLDPIHFEISAPIYSLNLIGNMKYWCHSMDFKPDFQKVVDSLTGKATASTLMIELFNLILPDHEEDLDSAVFKMEATGDSMTLIRQLFYDSVEESKLQWHPFRQKMIRFLQDDQRSLTKNIENIQLTLIDLKMIEKEWKKIFEQNKPLVEPVFAHMKQWVEDKGASKIYLTCPLNWSASELCSESTIYLPLISTILVIP